MRHIISFGDGIDADSPIAKLRALPHRDWMEPIRGITGLIILPQTKKYGLHDSGFRCMDFAAVHYSKAYCLLSGCSDVVHLGGIGGWNNPKWLDDKKTIAGNWSIDCLPNNGLLQIFARGELIVGEALSSFEVWHLRERPEKMT